MYSQFMMHGQKNIKLNNLNIRRPVNIKSWDSGFNSTGKTAIVKNILAEMPYSRGHTLRQFTVRVLEFNGR